MIDFLYRIFKLLVSVKLAVIVLIALGFLSAIGTIYEARYDAEYAQKLIYHSPWMYFLLGLMCVQLICVMVDRWPWKKRHIPFLLAHVGIIMTLAGSLVTRYWGVDGSMTFGIGEKSRQVMIGEKEIVVLGSFDGTKYTEMAAKTVDFLMRPPQGNPVELLLGQQPILVKDYYHYAYRKEEIISSKNKWDGPSIRFQLENDRVNLSRWLFLGRGQNRDEVDLGPARVILAEMSDEDSQALIVSSKKSGGEKEGGQAQDIFGEGNLIIFKVHPETRKLTYEIRSKREEKKVLRGDISEGMNLETGWMGLKLRILRFMPHAERVISFEQRERPTPLTTSALKISFMGKDHWVGENSPLRLFTDTNAYVFVYGNKRLNLGFDLELNEFRIGRYQGTMRAKSYESDVTVEGIGKTTISMNEPLKHRGYTFYQASFQEDEMGKPLASILSVNHDPGRFWKYLGSLLVVVGAILLFYRTRAQRAGPKVNRRLDPKDPNREGEIK